MRPDGLVWLVARRGRGRVARRIAPRRARARASDQNRTDQIKSDQIIIIIIILKGRNSPEFGEIRPIFHHTPTELNLLGGVIVVLI